MTARSRCPHFRQRWRAMTGSPCAATTSPFTRPWHDPLAVGHARACGSVTGRAGRWAAPPERAPMIDGGSLEGGGRRTPRCPSPHGRCRAGPEPDEDCGPTPSCRAGSRSLRPVEAVLVPLCHVRGPTRSRKSRTGSRGSGGVRGMIRASAVRSPTKVERSMLERARATWASRLCSAEHSAQSPRCAALSASIPPWRSPVRARTASSSLVCSQSIMCPSTSASAVTSGTT